MRNCLYSLLVASVRCQTSVAPESVATMTTVDTILYNESTNQAGMKVKWGTLEITMEGYSSYSVLVMGGEVGLGPNTLQENSFVQQWFSHEDPDAPGTYYTWTCNDLFASE